MRSYVRSIVACAIFLCGLGSIVGCRSKECARMIECCRAIEGKQGVGGICDARARSVEDPKTCKTVLETVDYMFDERDERPPKVCRMSPEG